MTERGVAGSVLASTSFASSSILLPVSAARRRQLNLSRTFAAAELEHVLAYSDGRDGLLADLHIVRLTSMQA